MLYDDLMEAHLRERHFVDPFALPGITVIASVVKNIPKYVLTEKVVQALVTIGDKRPIAIEKGLPMCFLPHPKIWVEFPYQYFKSAVLRTRGADKIRKLDTAEDPSSIGYLLEEFNDRILVTLVWVHKNFHVPKTKVILPSALHSCLGSFVIDRTASTKMATEAEIAEEQQVSDEQAYTYDYRHSRPDIEAFIRLKHRIYTEVSPYMKSYYEAMRRERAMVKGGLEQLDLEIMHDIGGEWRNALAILMILNSKSMVKIDEVDRSKLNKSRKKRGLPPTYNYRTADLYLSRVQGNRFYSSGFKNEDLIKHLVSAHLKIRKTGVFLWGAHVRGYKGDEPPVPIRDVKT